MVNLGLSYVKTYLIIFNFLSSSDEDDDDLETVRESMMSLLADEDDDDRESPTNPLLCHGSDVTMILFLKRHDSLTLSSQDTGVSHICLYIEKSDQKLMNCTILCL